MYLSYKVILLKTFILTGVRVQPNLSRFGTLFEEKKRVEDNQVNFFQLSISKRELKYDRLQNVAKDYYIWNFKLSYITYKCIELLALS